ncbi:MAG TPA: response regulator [Planctomycetaceae bacterium]|nr:response regulator [Planctomycetaceae bacterium]HQZ68936.1 response regulator [Planctomycetaceae bacterium]
MAAKAKKPVASKATSRSATKTSSKTASPSEFSQPKKRRPFTVFLVVDDRTLRESLSGFLSKQQIHVRDYMTAMEFYRDYLTPVPGVVITEIHLRGMSGTELFEKLTADKSDLVVSFIAGHADAPLAVQQMNAGASDFLMKPVTEEGLLALVARAYALHYDIDWDFVGEDLDDLEESLKRVSVREREVLDLVASGHSSRDIGSQLGVSTKTVEAHRARINDKMRADDLPHLIRMIMAYNEEHGQ